MDDLTVAESLKLKESLVNDDEEILDKPLTYHNRNNQVLPQLLSKVQSQLEDISEYALENEMKVNHKKSKAMLFNTAKKHDFTPALNMNNQTLEVVDEIKLLGVKITTDLKWNSNTKYITTKAYSRLWMIRRLKLLGASYSELVDCYTKQARSILEYCAVVWHAGLSQINSGDIERVQKAACSIILGKHYNSWIFRSFYSRRVDVLKHLWKTLVQCHIDYCSQLYMPGQMQSLQSIERLFYNFTSRIPYIKDMNYWARLQTLKMYSQERRMERYRIIYVWKILKGVVPNCGVKLAPDNERLGRKVSIPSLQRNGRKAIHTLREQSFQINGARLFNCLPKTLRNMTTCQDDFKEALDKYLSSVPDQPRMGSLIPEATDQLTGRQSNSLLAWTYDN